MTSRDKLEDPEAFNARVEKVCSIYAEASTLHERGVHVISTDEKTGMQAVARLHATKPSRPGLVERREFEYVRHGTLCLTANFEVATGRVVRPRIRETRTNVDFLEHVQHTMAADPDGTWIFIVDNLDPHKSEGLVRYVATIVGHDGDLGRMSASGVLKSRATRTEFLENPSHRVRFVFTPRHCSWLNQVELWFSVLARRVLRRGNFTSKDDLRQKVSAFITYFNAVLAKPYRWTYTGKLLAR